jgi:hypothetical protein
MPSLEPPSISWWQSGDPKVAVWDTITLPAHALQSGTDGLTNGAAVDDTESAFPGTILFVHDAEKLVCGVVQIPHDALMTGTLKPVVHWAKSTSAANAVLWEFSSRVLGAAGSTAGSWSSADNGTLAVSHADTAHVHALTTFTALNISTLGPSSIIAFRLYRRTDDALDTYAASVRLFAVSFHYQKAYGKRGSLVEYP